MSSIVIKLQYLDFPECTKEALNYLIRYFSSTQQIIPGIGGGKENIASDVAQKYILEISRRCSQTTKKLNALHELQLLDLICSTLQGAPEHACYRIFSVIFGGHCDPIKLNLMTKLVSMAISISCSSVLGCAALWMQEQGSQSQNVCDLSQRLVDDYCLLYPNVGAAFKRLPKVSSLFTCNFVTALTTIYTYTELLKSPPFSLLKCIVDWISDDPCLCSDSVRLVRIQSTFTCPISGLVRWCILGPLVHKDTPKAREIKEMAAKNLAIKDSTVSDLMKLFSRLHLSILLSLDSYQSMELNQSLFSYTDMYVVSKMLSVHYQNGQCPEDLLHMVNTSVDRLAQTIQLALTTGALPGDFDIRQLCNGLPPNRLLEMITTMKYGRKGAEAMDLS